MRSPLVGTVLLLLAGCSVDANYSLQLIPHVPLNQSPFQGGPEAHLRIRDAQGNVDWVGLGPFGSGTREESGFGPLDRHTIGLALGPQDPAQSLSGLRAWGESAPLTASTGRQELRAFMLVAQLDGIGSLGELRGSATGSAAAALRDGRIFLFGGAGAGGGDCTDEIQKLPTLQAPSWSFSRVSERLPEGACYAVARTVELGGREMIVVSGGEPSLNDTQSRSRRVSLFDPATETFVWSEEGELGRSRHATRAFSDGRLLIVGAHLSGSGAPNNATWELVDLNGRSFEGFGSLSVAPWDFMSAEVSEGLALCGGAGWAGITVTPTSTCVILRPDGSTRSLPDLPTTLRAGSMTTLADGRLLVAGGIDHVAEAGDPTEGSTVSFILDPANDSAWSPTGSLPAPRTYSTLLPDAAGGAIMLGGVGAGWAFSGSTPRDPADCALRFDPSNEEWESLPLCASAGSGLSPTTARTPGGLVLVLEGRIGATSGGVAFGVVGLGPSRP